MPDTKALVALLLVGSTAAVPLALDVRSGGSGFQGTVQGSVRITGTDGTRVTRRDDGTDSVRITGDHTNPTDWRRAPESVRITDVPVDTDGTRVTRRGDGDASTDSVRITGDGTDGTRVTR